MIAIVINGEPKPAGSKRAIPRKNGKGAIVIDANPDSRQWKNLVADAASQAMRDADRLDPDSGEILVFHGPLVVVCDLYRPRPKGHYKADGSLSSTGLRNPYPTTRPDASKLWRGTEDACTGIVWHDDSQIIAQTIRKRWGTPRAEIYVTPAGSSYV